MSALAEHRARERQKLRDQIRLQMETEAEGANGTASQKGSPTGSLRVRSASLYDNLPPLLEGCVEDAKDVSSRCSPAIEVQG